MTLDRSECALTNAEVVVSARPCVAGRHTRCHSCSRQHAETSVHCGKKGKVPGHAKNTCWGSGGIF
jgi:hypothetical protein